jgi:hypothetical protein
MCYNVFYKTGGRKMFFEKGLHTTLGMVFISLIVLTGCFSHWQGNENLGSITFNFGSETHEWGPSASYYMANSSQAITMPQSIISRLTHTVTLERIENNSVVERIPPFSITGASHSEPVAPGEWRINLISRLDGDVFAEADQILVTVLSGRSAAARMPMNLFYTVIFTRAELAAIGIDPDFPLSGKYILASNIDLAGINWTPIGMINITDPVSVAYTGDPFTGIFDGNNQTIRNLSCPPTANIYPFGLFGAIGKDAVVRNVNLAGVNIDVTYYSYGVGSLVGLNDGGKVENSSATGDVKGIFIVGGLVGYSSGTIQNSSANIVVNGELIVGGLVGGSAGNVQNCSATGNVAVSNSSGGGLVGIKYQGYIENSYATGRVIVAGSGFQHSGGLVGQNYGTVQNSYAAGEVIGKTQVGGLVGFNEGTVKNSYAIGVVSGDAGVGGLVGENFEGGIVVNSYANGNINGTDDIGGLVGANEGTVENSYATGNVEGNNNVGGLVGLNEGRVQNSVALNRNITSTSAGSGNFGRVAGKNNTNDGLSNNYGREDMQMNSALNSWISDRNGIDGDDIESLGWYNQGWWENTNNWNIASDASAWNFGNNSPWNPPVSDANPANNRLPTLRGMPPSALQIPQVRD